MGNSSWEQTIADLIKELASIESDSYSIGSHLEKL
jgi:hypothetical protein